MILLLLFEKVPTLFLTHILFIIFSSFIVYLYSALPLFPPNTPKSTSEALSHPNWKQTMVEEINALYSNGTWELVALPPGKSPVGFRWVYTVKVGPNGQVDRLKARLVVKGYTR